MRTHFVMVVVSACLMIRCQGTTTGYKYCLYECANCVQLWGAELYDGQRCAKCCLYSDGAKVDPECKVWTTNRISYKKKDLEYVRGILTQKRQNDDRINYNYIFGGDMPDFCFNYS